MMNTTTEQLAERRRVLGVSLRDLAARTGIQPATLVRTLNGTRDRIYLHEAQAIAEALGGRVCVTFDDKP